MRWRCFLLTGVSLILTLIIRLIFKAKQAKIIITLCRLWQYKPMGKSLRLKLNPCPEGFPPKVHARHLFMRDMTLQLLWNYATVCQSKFAASDQQKVKKVKSLRPWKRGTGKPYPEQKTMRKPLLLFNKYGKSTVQVIAVSIFHAHSWKIKRILQNNCSLVLKIENRKFLGRFAMGL